MKKGNGSLFQLRAIYLVTTSFLVILSIYTSIQLKNLIATTQLVNHTVIVTQSLHHISSNIFESETNSRGFLLSGNPLWLQKKETALANLVEEKETLNQLLKTDKVGGDSLLLINKFIDNLVAHKDAKQSQLPNVNNLSRTTISEESLDRERAIASIKKIDAYEIGVLKMHSENSTQLYYVMPLYVIVLFLGSLIILWTSYIKINTALSHSQYLRSELIIQNEEKEEKAATLIIANKELELQNIEKEQKAAELIIANKELELENNEKECRAAELIIANQELAYQNIEKERKAKELVVANKELAFENKEKEKRAAELVIANKVLLNENEIKEKRATELTNLNEELRVFTQIASHDLQEPLRKIQMFASRISESEHKNLSERGRNHFEIIEDAATRMRTLIEDLIAYSQTNNEERVFEVTNLNDIIEETKLDLEDLIAEKQATIETYKLGEVKAVHFQFRQLMNNLISNSLKFSNKGIPTRIVIVSEIKKGKDLENPELIPEANYCHIAISDNGIGFESAYSEKIFEVFQRLNGKEKYKGTGIGLAIVKKIVDNHNGIIKASGEPGKGARFDIYLPS